MEKHTYQAENKMPLLLECGKVLPDLTITYHTAGTLNTDKTNVIWVFHALTANSDVQEWWPGMVGSGLCLDTDRYFIVCANIIGSCYGSTGPVTALPEEAVPRYADFPLITIRDMVQAHLCLRDHLGIQKIHLGIGGSMGGYQLLEWTYQQPDFFENIVLLATSAAESAWGKAIHSAQRLAIEADPTWKNTDPKAGRNGLIAARSIGMLTYRNYQRFKETQQDETPSISNHKADSYQKYQGQKLADRFPASVYHLLTRSMDSHHLGRNRGTLAEAIAKVTTHALVIGLTSDLLNPTAEQQFLAEHLPHGKYVEIDSPYGHDGFLIEVDEITRQIKAFLKTS